MVTPYTPGRAATRLPAWEQWRGQQVWGFRVAKYRAGTDEYLGELHPEEGGTVACDTSQAVTRSLKITLAPGDAEGWDPVEDRVRVWLVDAAGTEWPIGGRYMAVDDTAATDSAGTVRPLALADETWQLSHEIGRGFSAYAAAGDSSRQGRVQNVARVAERFLTRYMLFNPGAETGPSATPRRPWRMPYRVDPSPYQSSAAWSGTSTGTSVMEALAVAGDYMRPWVDNMGTYRLLRTFDPADPGRVPDFDFDRDGWDADPVPAETTDLINAPNRYIVVANSGTGNSAAGPVVGTYDVPATAPWSIARRGYVVPKTETMPVETIPQAAAAARAIAQRQQVYRRVTIHTPPDPRHDAHQVVRWRGETWLQTAWSMPLTPGASMSHTLRRAYS